MSQRRTGLHLLAIGVYSLALVACSQALTPAEGREALGIQDQTGVVCSPHDGAGLVSFGHEVLRNNTDKPVKVESIRLADASAGEVIDWYLFPLDWEGPGAAAGSLNQSLTASALGSELQPGEGAFVGLTLHLETEKPSAVIAVAQQEGRSGDVSLAWEVSTVPEGGTCSF